MDGSKYFMRIKEITTKSINAFGPVPPDKARINALKQSVERTREQLKVERERQQKQREVERKQKLQQRSTLA